MAAKKSAAKKPAESVPETPSEPQPSPEEREAAFLAQQGRGGAEISGWPGVKVESPEEHDARRKAEADAYEKLHGRA